MDDLRGRPFTGRGRWGDAAFLFTCAVIGMALVWYVITLDDPLFLVPIAWYTGIIAVLALALVIAYLVSARLPDGRAGLVDGDPATIVRIWPWQWRWNVTADAGIAILSAYLFVSSLGSPEARPIAPIALAIPLIWFGMSTVLVLTGRRRLGAIRLTDTELIRDSINGRERIRRDQVTDVKVVVDWVFITFSGSADRSTGPRPWRSDRKLDDSMIMIDPELLGPGPEQIVTWLRRELDLDATVNLHPETTSTMHRLTRWLRRSR